MKVLFHTFSATGNTARAVQVIADRLAADGHDVSIQPVAVGAPVDPEAPELTVVAFPIWAWAAPHFVLAHVRRLPPGRGARAAVFATCGGFGAQGVGEVARRLRRRGYRVACSGEAVYPDNWTLAMGPPPDKELSTALVAGDEQAARFAENMMSAHPTTFACAWGHRLWSRPIALLFRSFGRRFLGKAFIADATCTSCGLCAATCPVGAIRMEGAPARPRWNAGCAACYRCINLCPVQAIQVSVARLAIHLGLNLALTGLALGAIGWIRPWMPLPGAAGLGLAVLVAGAALVLATGLQLTALDALLHGLETRTPLRGLFLKSHTRRFGRYRAPGFQPGETGHP